MEWLMHFLAAAVLLVIAEVILHKLFALSGLSYSRTYSKRHVFAGEAVQLVETVTNNKPLPVPVLQVECRLPAGVCMKGQDNILAHDESYHKSLFSLMPFTKITRRHEVTCARRGMYQMKSLALSAVDLFGLSAINVSQWPVDASFIVYPAIIGQDDIKLPSHGFFGDVIVKRWVISDPFMLSGIREYQSGDPMKTINWKASAKHGDWMVNQQDYTANTKLFLVLNIETGEHQWDRNTSNPVLEHAISVIAGIAQKAVQSGLDVAFACNGYVPDARGRHVQLPFGAGEPQLYLIWETLAMLVTDRAVSFQRLMSDLNEQGIAETDFLVFSAYSDQRIEDQLTLLRRAGNAVALQLLEGRDTQ